MSTASNSGSDSDSDTCSDSSCSDTRSRSSRSDTRSRSSHSDTRSRNSSSADSTTHSGRYREYHRNESGSVRRHPRPIDNRSRRDMSPNDNNRNHQTLEAAPMQDSANFVQPEVAQVSSRIGIHCGICLASVAGPTTTPCGHIFCRECICRALRSKRQCPCCKRYVLRKELIGLFI